MSETTGGQERSDLGNVLGGQERSDLGNVLGGQERSDLGNVLGGQERSDESGQTASDLAHESRSCCSARVTRAANSRWRSSASAPW